MRQPQRAGFEPGLENADAAWPVSLKVVCVTGMMPIKPVEAGVPPETVRTIFQLSWPVWVAGMGMVLKLDEVKVALPVAVDRVGDSMLLPWSFEAETA